MPDKKIEDLVETNKMLSKNLENLNAEYIQQSVNFTRADNLGLSAADKLSALKSSKEEYEATIQKYTNVCSSNSSSTDIENIENTLKNNLGHESFEDLQNVLLKMKTLTDINNKFTGSLDSFTEIFARYQEYLETLTLEQKGALVNILMIIAIFLGVMNLLAIVASERIIEYFKLDQRLPWAARFFRLRKTVQHYSFIWNFVFVLLAFVFIFVFNIFVLTKGLYF